MDGEPPAEEDFSVLPIEDRLAHKNWKARVSGYEALVKLFQRTTSDNDPAFRPYLNNSDLLKKIATDSNAVAQERGVEALNALVKNAGENAAGTRGAVVPALVDKCLGSTRAGTKSQAIELALQYIEVENGAAGVVADVIPGLNAKQPKAVAGCVSVLKEAVRLFGAQVVPPKPILQILPKIFGHTDKIVRAEGTSLTQALYQYIGHALDPFLADLKPVQVKELKESFEALETEGKGRGTLKPERLTREGARAAEAAGPAGADEEVVAEEAAPPDPRQFAEEVDVVSKFPSGWQGALASSKWKDRKEALDEMLAVLKASLRIQPAGELGDLAKTLGTMVQKDANIMCVMGAAGCIEGLANGLGSNFARSKDVVVAPMLERLKERKANVTDAIGVALDAVFACTSLSDVLGEIQTALGSKNPQVKEGTLKFLSRCLSTTPTPIPQGDVKPVSEQLASIMEDSFEGNRNEAATCLGTLMKMIGERQLGPVMEGLADVRKVKVMEAFEKATVKAKAGAGGPGRGAPAKSPPAGKKAPPAAKPAPKAAPPPPPVEESLDALEDSKPVRKPPARLAAKKPAAATESSVPAAPASSAPAVKKAPPPAAAGKSKPPPPAAPGQLDSVKFRYSPEDAEAQLSDLIPSNIQTDFADSNWKTRLAALEEMMTWVEANVTTFECEVVVRFLKKGWGEKNFQVSAKLYGILDFLAKECPTFGRSSAALCVPHLSEKLGDVKLKKPAGEALLTFAEKTSLQFVLGQAYDSLSKQKAPKVLADSITWIESAITEFGIAGISLRTLIEFLKTALGNSNAAVRTSATKAMVTVKLFAGPSVKDLLEGLNPQLLNTILAEFDKVEGNSPPEPVRKSADLAQMEAAGGGSSKKGAASGGDALDDLFPRVELDGLLKGTTIMADAKSDAWKTKKEALETLQAILDQGSNKRLKPTMGEISQVLKARVVDTNKAVQSLALDIVARVATGMGKPFDKYTRFFTVPVTSVFADQKAPARAAAVQTLTAMATACEGLDTMLSDLAKGLEAQNPLQRATLLGWLSDWFKSQEGAPVPDLSTWTGSILSALDDRSGDVRKAAQGMLPYLIAGAGYDYVMKQTDSLKPASKKSAVPLIQAAHASAPAAAASSSASAKKVPGKPAAAAPPPAEEAPVAPVEAPAKPAMAPLVARKKLPIGMMNRPSESRPETPQEEAPRTRLGIKPPNGAPAKRLVSGVASGRTTAVPSPSSNSGLLFTSISGDYKKNRLAKDAHRWINEAGTTRKDLADLLRHQMEPHTSRELVDLLFSHDHNAVNDHVSGLSQMADFFATAEAEDVRAICVANADLPLKYVSIKAHEPQSNLTAKCLDCVDAVLELLRNVDYQLTEPEALCFIPTLVYKLGDAREPVRARVQQIVQDLPKVYAYNRLFGILLEYGLKSKVAKTRQGSLDEMASLVKRYGMTVCDPNKAMPAVGTMIADKDPQVRKSALGVLSEAYVLVGEKIWSQVGPLPPKDKTQLEERLRRIAGPSTAEHGESQAPRAQVNRVAAESARPASPSTRTRIGGGLPRPGAMAGASRLARPNSPMTRAPIAIESTRSSSPVRTTSRPAGGIPGPSGIGRLPGPAASRLAAPRARAGSNLAQPAPIVTNGHRAPAPASAPPIAAPQYAPPDDFDSAPDEITVVISSILSNDPSRSVDALKKIQAVLAEGPDAGPTSAPYRELAEHTEGLIETITLQIGHVFSQSQDIVVPENFRLAKHLIQTLNAFCDHTFLAESLTIDALTALLQELTLRLWETDDSQDSQVKDLSRFINMIILRLFATARRMSVFRSLMNLLLSLVKPFPAKGTPPDSKEAKIAELVLKCIWKLARNMPQDLEKQALDPVELFPAIEHFLQSVPPNEWRARATNKVPCGDMPLRTIKVIIQHVVAHHGDEVYDLLSSAFEDPSATIVYPYVYRILNSSTRVGADAPPSALNGDRDEPVSAGLGDGDSGRGSPPRTASTISFDNRRSASPVRTSGTSSSANGHALHTSSPSASEPDPDDQLTTIIKHISSEKTGAMHKEGITELHQFLKAYPHKKARVDALLESTGVHFRKYITRALATRAAEDSERDAAVSHTLSRLEGGSVQNTPVSPVPRGSLDVPGSPRSPTRPSSGESNANDRLSRLHNIFQYRANSTAASPSR